MTATVVLVRQIVVDHHADVYGVAAHPQRPFVISTASRDTTIRLWSLDKQYSKLKVRALCGEDVLASVRGPGP